MILCQDVAKLRELVANFKKENKSIGLVPTMGALHEGHASLINASAKENDITIVSVFVNPTQFGPNEDYEAYPRTLENDCIVAQNAGADVVFAPKNKDLYPNEDMTWVEVTGDITKVLCGRTRPIHFRGVTTVVSKLFNLSRADRAYFGLKDAQQTEVLRRMVDDLFFNVELRIMPIIREADGLAKSSRNTYLNEEERKAALILSKAVFLGKKMVEDGETSAAAVKEAMIKKIESEPMAKIDYVEAVDGLSMQPVEEIKAPVLVAMAVYIGKTRLIDNFIVE